MKHESQFAITRPRPEAASRLFCFPHAGGGPVAFFDWSDRLGKDVEFVCLRYAGRESRLKEKPHTCVDELVREIGSGFVDMWADKPFAFYGHSLGAIVAFELARQIRRSEGFGPNQLFVGAARAPHLVSPHPPLSGFDNLQFVERLQARYGGIPATIYRDRDVLEMFIPAMRADIAAFEGYRLQPDTPLEIPITAFAGRDDTAVQVESVGEWALHTVADFDMNVLPGGHFFSETGRRELIQALQLRIATHLIPVRLREQNSTFAG